MQDIRRPLQDQRSGSTKQPQQSDELLGPLAPVRNTRKVFLFSAVGLTLLIAIILLITQPKNATDMTTLPGSKENAAASQNSTTPPDPSESIIDPSVKQNTDVPYSSSRRY